MGEDAVVLVPDGAAGRQEWVAERFRVVQARIRHAATGLYLTAEGDRAGAAVALRPKFPDSGEDRAYWRQTWRAFVQRGNGRLLAVNDLSGCVLGLGAPVGGGRPLVLETTGAPRTRPARPGRPPSPRRRPSPNAAPTWRRAPDGCG
ncbi:hypothetical protein [Streptomyces sp. NPDC127108]|uniref:hypothetical protein n=1 Tax=Streptomyces sp. NPDC127108 TaxID=3345361 RepID=UPI003644343E